MSTGSSQEREPQTENNGSSTPPCGPATSGKGQHGAVVAQHYNKLEEKGLEERFNSPIFYMRNFNNWVKSALIDTYVEQLRKLEYTRAIRVLDICCGKGGDLMKWQKARIEHLVCADIAEVSMQQCQTRYTDMTARGPRSFTAEFIVADCTKERLREKYADASRHFDLVSCQFGLHYSFESLPQAECMMRNVSECLRPGGYFIGTIPDAYEIVTRCRRSESNSFSNKIFKIELLFDDRDGFPLFGAKYDFCLEGVVECPEFLVYFPLLVKLAAKYGLEPVLEQKFDKFFDINKKSYGHLFTRMKVFESYPSAEGASLLGAMIEYQHAQKYIDDQHVRCVGTMRKEEWEAATLYKVFAFKKCKSTLDANGKPVYQLEQCNGSVPCPGTQSHST